MRTWLKTLVNDYVLHCNGYNKKVEQMFKKIGPKKPEATPQDFKKHGDFFCLILDKPDTFIE